MAHLPVVWREESRFDLQCTGEVGDCLPPGLVLHCDLRQVLEHVGQLHLVPRVGLVNHPRHLEALERQLEVVSLGFLLVLVCVLVLVAAFLGRRSVLPAARLVFVAAQRATKRVTLSLCLGQQRPCVLNIGGRHRDAVLAVLDDPA